MKPQMIPQMIPQAWRIARRELRGGLGGFRVFLACLALGVAAIAAVGSVRVSIQEGLSREGATILGGEAQMSFTYRYASQAEREFMAARALRISETVDFRSMLLREGPDGPERGLTQVRAVDDLYPLKGAVTLEPAMSIEAALADGGIVVDPVLIARMGLNIGDQVRLGGAALTLRAALIRAPDSAGGGFGLGPRSLVALRSLEDAGLLGAGSLFDSDYRLELAPGTELAALEAEALAAFRDTGLRWRDARNAAPGITRFIDRIGAFLVLVGLAGLAVGGVGVSAAVRSYLERKVAVIATLKTLGAETRLIFAAYLMQIGALAGVGIGLGLGLGAAIPLALAPLIEARLPVPVALGVQVGPLAEAALYGGLTALIFTLWPLSRTAGIRAAALYRESSGLAQSLPGWRALAVIGGLLAGLVGASAWLSGLPRLALASAGGIAAALVILVLAAWAVQTLARRGARAKWVRGHSALRLALGAVGAPGGGASSVILSLGLGLTVLATVGQIDANLRAALARDLPEVAPSYFFVDIQSDQLPAFLARVETDPAVSRVDHAPMLRGVITRINGAPAREVAGEHWVLRGDRGVTYAARPAPGTEITAGQWWAPDHSGPPEISFAAEEAAELGLTLGDRLTINILGRDIEATITSLREVDFSNAAIGFVLTMSPNAVAGAPHTHIATVYATEAAEPAILRDVAGAAPNITAIRVRDGIAMVSEALKGLAAATSYGAGATLLTGFIVLIGAAAAGERARVFEAAVLKTLGATRATILLSFALRAAILGAAAGLVAIGAGALAGWGVMRFVMETDYAFEPVSAFAIVIGGALATLVAGLAFAWRPLAARPAGVLRAQD